MSLRRYFVAGLGQTGTTAISKRIQNTTGIPNYYPELLDISFFERLGRSEEEAVVEVVYDHWMQRPRLFNAIVHDDMNTRFLHNIFVTRDPRAEMICRLHYLAYRYFVEAERPSDHAERWLHIFRKKDADPGAVSLGEMLDYIEDNFGCFGRQRFQSGARAQQHYANHLASIPDDRKLLVRYEDFIAGKVDGQLGPLLSGERDTGAEFDGTNRSGANGDWSAFILERDREWVTEALGRSITALGYDPGDMPQGDEVSSKGSSEYVERLISSAIADRQSEAARRAAPNSDPVSTIPIPYPPAELIGRSAGKVNTAGFEAVGKEFLGLFKDRCDLQPDHAVLDVGCGVGRMARALTQYMSEEGLYRGFDVDRPQIEWCQKNITPTYPNFQFTRADVANTTYNKDGATNGEAFTFPYDDDSFDLVFLTSVFTHMLPQAMNRYLSEVARVLKPGGRSLITYFLLNDDLRQKIQAGGSIFTFRHVITPGVVSVEREHRPEDVVGYEEPYIRERYGAVGLKIIEPVMHGNWSGVRPEPRKGQDIIVARSA